MSEPMTDEQFELTLSRMNRQAMSAQEAQDFGMEIRQLREENETYKWASARDVKQIAKLRKVVDAARAIQTKTIHQHELPPFALYGEEASNLEEALRELDEGEK